MTMALAGCGKKQEEMTPESSNLTVSDEIAEIENEEVVPEEAKKYTAVSFNIPEGLSPQETNTDTEAYYLSDTVEDLSYIAYSRNAKPINYKDVTKDDYEESFLKKYAVDPEFDEFVELQKDDYTRTKIVMRYTFGRTTFVTTEYIFVTDSYVFTISYCLDKKSDKAESFEDSAESMTLISVVSSVSDNEVPGIEVSANGILTEEEVMGKISAGASNDVDTESENSVTDTIITEDSDTEATE